MNLSTYISKDESLILRGMAAIMLVIYHTFNSLLVVNNDCLIYIGDTPLSVRIASGCNPVAIYLFLAGYGMFYQQKRKNISQMGGARFKSLLQRSLKLYSSYWISIIVFVVFYGMVLTHHYIFSLPEFIDNILGWRSSYNFATWFLLHYVVLVLISPFLFNLIERITPKLFVLINLVVYLTACMIQSKFNSTYLLDHYLLYQFVQFLTCSLSFTVGAVFCFYSDKKFEIRWCKGWMLIVVALLFFIARCYIPRPVTFPFTAIALIFLLSQVEMNKIVKVVIGLCGAYSMEIWLVHSYFNKYLFANYYYSLKVPLLIFIAILFSCIIYGWLIRQIKKIQYEHIFCR